VRIKRHMSGLWLMVVRRLWGVVKMGLEVVVSGILGKLGLRRGMRSGAIGLVSVRRRRIRSRALAWGSLFLWHIHVSASSYKLRE
jgi:hypothetical protein